MKFDKLDVKDDGVLEVRFIKNDGGFHRDTLCPTAQGQLKAETYGGQILEVTNEVWDDETLAKFEARATGPAAEQATNQPAIHVAPIGDARVKVKYPKPKDNT